MSFTRRKRNDLFYRWHASVLLLAIRQFGNSVILTGSLLVISEKNYRDTAATPGFADVALLIDLSIYDALRIERMAVGSLTLLGRSLLLGWLELLDRPVSVRQPALDTEHERLTELARHR